jgi:GNAT superfamily N-acetyltransferase
VRAATAADLEDLVRLRLEFIRTFRTPPEGAEVALRRYFAHAVPSGEYTGMIAEAGSRVIASGGLLVHVGPPTSWDLSGREGYVMNMYTETEWRQHGIAAAVLMALLDVARARGLRRVWLRATPAGLRVYERAGFRPIASALELEL